MAEARGDSANTEVVIDVRMGRVGGGGGRVTANIRVVLHHFVFQIETL